jgi:hypothetical protein
MAGSHALLLSGLVLWALRAPAQRDSQPARARMFDAPEALSLTLTADFNALSKDRGESKQEHTGALAFVRPAGDSVALDVRLRTRGHFRLQRRICDFPPLKLSFDKQQVKHTVFAGQGGLKLVVHCQDRDSYEQNLLQEYLLYRVFNLITEKSFRARLARVTYLDRSGKAKPVTRYAFFIEDDDAMARRAGAKVLEQKGLSQLDTDVEQTGLVAMFEYLIGNTDFSYAALHNIVLIRDSAGTVFAVPYDFDWSGVVSASYAVPDSRLGIKTVRERLYRGYCRTPEQLGPTIARFDDRKDSIYALFRSQEGLDPKHAEQTLRYFDDFYRTINDPRAANREFVRNCVHP